jgi:hypothetical protein
VRAREVAKVIGVGAAVAAVVLATAFGAGLLLSSPTDASAAPQAPAYDTDELDAQPIEDDGSVEAPSGGESKTVVVDVSHGNDVGENDLQPFVDALVEAGHDVRFHSGGQSSGIGARRGSSQFNETLRGADALVVVSPGTAYTEDEIDGVAAFEDAGGRVLLAADPPTTSSSQESSPLPGLGSSSASSAAGQPANLGAHFDVTFGAGYLYDVADNANNFQRVYASGEGGMADGVEEAVLLAATPLETGPDASAVLSADASLSVTRDVDTYTVAARNGNVLALGDTDLLSEGVATDGDNDAFASTVAAFLVDGDKEPGEPSNGEDDSGGGQQPSTTASTAVVRTGTA